jgi:hypothetical protein
LARRERLHDDQGKRRLDELRGAGSRVVDVERAVHAMGFLWGVSDGD